MNAVWSVLVTLFAWPDGIVVGNLIASAMCVCLAAVHIERLLKRHHAQRMQQAEATHALVAEIHRRTT